MNYDYDNEYIDETNPRNIWRKRRKLSNNHQMSSVMQTELTKIEEDNSNNNNQGQNNQNFKTYDKYPSTNTLHMRPHDHQVPTVFPMHHDDLMVMSNRFV